MNWLGISLGAWVLTIAFWGFFLFIFTRLAIVSLFKKDFASAGIGLLGLIIFSGLLYLAHYLSTWYHTDTEILVWFFLIATGIVALLQVGMLLRIIIKRI